MHLNGLRKPNDAAPLAAQASDSSASPEARSKTVYIRPVVRSGARSAAQAYSTLALPITLRYSLKGEVFSRIAFAVDGQDAAIVDRQAPTDRERLLPYRGVAVQLREVGTKTAPLAEVVSGRDGAFEFVDLLEEGREYELVAVLSHAAQRLAEERVTISGIRVDRLPQDRGETHLSLAHRNHVADDALAGDHVADESEQVRCPLETNSDGRATLSLRGAAALLFNTLLLDTPYDNQNRNVDGGQKSVNIDDAGDVSGSLSLPTSAAMALGHFGTSAPSATTGSIALAAFRAWQRERFPGAVGTTDVERYRVRTENDAVQNVWECWPWVHRAVRQVVGLPLSTRPLRSMLDVDGRDTIPVVGQWLTHWDEGDLFDAAPYLRRQIGRGWPIVAGTNLTATGQAIAIRGLVIRHDGAIHRIIVNNPWGDPGPGEARAAYYGRETRGQTGSGLRLSSHLVLRRGTPRETVIREMVVPGERAGKASNERGEAERK